jgi:hypothetical protein
MTENKPRSPDRKLSLIPTLSLAAGFAAIALAALVYSAGEKRDAAPPPPAAPLPAPPAAPVESEATLNRTELIKEANAIAAAYAAGAQRPLQGKDPLAGRRFEIRIPFGCDGPQPRGGSAQAFYEFNPDNRTVRLVARPATWTTLPLVQNLPKRGKIEAVEGFWIPHPWSYAEACPPPRDQPVPASPTPAAAQTLGLAQLFEAGGSRVLRRGDRPYETLVKLSKDDEPPVWRGYQMRLEGRFATYPDGRVARCWSESNDHQPVCLYAVQFDRVAFESAVDGKVLAEWRE